MAESERGWMERRQGHAQALERVSARMAAGADQVADPILALALRRAALRLEDRAARLGGGEG